MSKKDKNEKEYFNVSLKENKKEKITIDERNYYSDSSLSEEYIYLKDELLSSYNKITYDIDNTNTFTDAVNIRQGTFTDAVNIRQGTFTDVVNIRQGTFTDGTTKNFQNQLKTPGLLGNKKYKNIYCVNCGEKGHVVKDCSGPITSFGIIAFKIINNEKEELYDKNSKLQDIITTEKNNLYIPKNIYPKTKFLMIQRKDTMGFTDFVRGKYPENEKECSKTLPIFLNEMTTKEKNNLLTKSFDEIWGELWVNHDSKCFKNEYDLAYKKFKKLNIKELITKSLSSFDYAELGFPKGRRNMKETNIACAEREFFEETGYDKSCYDFIKNYPTIHEEFRGTNGIKYRHIYYLVKMKEGIPPPRIDYKNKIQTGEVQNIGWLTYDECISVIRPYDVAKKRVIKKVYRDLLEMKNNFICSNFYYTSKKHFHKTPFSHIKTNFSKNFHPNSL
jgi:8-oxo-dGTP pyrophosphatase MutT (NUDIX family)